MEKVSGDGIYRKMIEEIEDYAILLLDNKGTVMNWNSGAEKIKGYKANEIIGKNFNLFYSSEDRKNKLPEKLLKKASVNGKASDEGWRLRKDNTCFWGSILITAIHDEDKNVIGFSKVTRNLTERKNAGETQGKLIQSQESFKIIFNASSSAIILTDTESRKIIEVNRSFLSTFGFNKEEVRGCDAEELGIVSHETRLMLADILQKNEFIKNVDILCFTKHKKEINCILSADVFEMDGKKYYLSVFQDISKVKELEKQVKASEEKFHKAFDGSAVGMAITRLSDSTYLEVNESFVKMTGYSKEELIGRTSLECGFIVSIEKREDILKKIIQDGSAKHFELTIRNKSGKIVEILSSVDTVLISDEKYAINTIYDITERKKTEEQLGHLAAIVEYSDDAVISKSTEGIIKSWNKGAERMFGFNAEKVIGKNISLIVPPEYEMEEKNILEKICNNEVIDHYETVRVKMNEEPFHVSITVSPLKNKEGKIIAISKIIRDITERKNAEDSSKLKDAFLSIISHEIRTPLNAIMGFSDVLLKRKLEETEKEYVGIIKTAGETLLTIINDTIDMSKIEAHTMTFTENNFSIQEVFQTINKMLAEKAKVKNLELVFTIDENVQDVLVGDQVRLQQIILNITTNAINFTEKGIVNVYAKVLKREKNIIEFSITDTGIGISIDKLKTIFNRFKQVENQDNRKQGGLGLGLSIAKSLVELQGGSLTVESKLAKGSIFTFSMPFKKLI